MLDSDIAMYFGVTTGNLNKAKNRNIERFPSVLTRSQLIKAAPGLKERGIAI